MPIVGQIQPSYLHPHVATHINDNTQFEDRAVVVDDNVQMMSVVFSGKGRDNKFLKHTNEKDWENEYGIPNINLYGQAGYMAAGSLGTSLVTMRTIRLMPDNAAYANAIITVKIKEDKTDSDNPKMVIKTVSQFQADVKSEGDLEAHLENLRNDVPDSDGFVTIPLALIYSLGRGVYGDDYRFRICPSFELDKENEYKNIRLEVIGNDKGLRTIGFFDGAVHLDALNGKRSIYIQDIVNDDEDGSDHLGLMIDPSAVKTIFESYKKLFPDTTLTEKTFDPFTFTDKKSKLIPGVEIDAESITFDAVDGIVLAGGSDGDLGLDKAADFRTETMNNLLVAAFKGTIDKSINSTRRVPTDVLLDANYPAEAKRSLYDLAIRRNASALYLDAGILTTPTQAIDWATDMETLGHYIMSKNCQHYKVRDPYTYKPMKVTITHFFATAIPLHFKNIGRFVPFAGPKIRIENMMKDSLLPVIDMDDMDLKEELYEKRVNYIECMNEGVYQRGAQGTSQNVWSDLSEEHNVHELFDIKKTIERFSYERIYDFAETEDRNRFTDDAKKIFANRIGTRLREFDVYFDMNKFEEERSILHCYISVIFKTIAKRVIVEIDINKRV